MEIQIIVIDQILIDSYLRPELTNSIKIRYSFIENRTTLNQ